jgi:hypothetical protein
MSFIAPSFLWALPLAGFPILLHLLSRRRAERIPFSDLALLRRVYARAMPRTRLRQWLLVAARCLILLFLILAYARPVLRATPTEAAQAKGAAPAGLDLVLLLDNSYSMGFRERGKTRFELSKQEAEDLVRGLGNSDRVSVSVFSDRLQSGTLGWLAPREALAALDRARLGLRTTDYSPALRAAGEFLSNDAGRRRVVLVLSDGARHGFRGARPTLDPGILWLGLRWPAAQGNAAVVLAAPSADSSAAKPRLSVRVSGPAAGQLDLWVEGRRVQGSALKAAEKEQAAVLPLPGARDPLNPAWSGYVALRPDALSADDSYYFSFGHPARPKVLCLYGNPAFLKAPNAGYFLRELFGGDRESLLEYNADFLELGRLGEAKLEDYRLVILSDFKDVSPSAAARLERFVRLGGGLWVLPGARTEESGFDSLNAWLPAPYGSLVSGEGPGLRLGAAQDPKAWKEFDLGKVAVSRYYLLTARPGTAVDFKSSAGYPLMVSGAHGEGRATEWACALDPGWSNLVVKPVFAAWVQASLDGLSGRQRRPAENLQEIVGEPLIRAWPPNEPAPANVRMKAPDGSATTLWLKDRTMTYPEAAAPGLYTLTEEGSGRRWVYAVNLDRSTGESDLAPLEDPPWRTLDSESVASDFRLEVYGRDARGPVLAAAVTLLLMEMFLALRAEAMGMALLMILLSVGPSSAQQGDRFVWSQLKIGPEWDPYPGIAPDALEFLSTLTSVLSVPERRVLTLKDKALYSSPLVILSGREAPAPLDEEERRNLRDYLLAGGLLWIEDASGSPVSSFDRWVRQTLPLVLPETELAPLPSDHVVYKTFFLLRGPAGRVMVRDSLEGVSWAGRTAVIYSRNDILGAWAKDALGKPLYDCLPGGELQRQKAKRLTLNIIMYGLTGNYKSDAVHQPYLLQKMRSGIP